MKYITYYLSGKEYCILFPNTLTHASMLNVLPDRVKLIGAGFYGHGKVMGFSISLKLGISDNDLRIIKGCLGIKG